SAHIAVCHVYPAEAALRSAMLSDAQPLASGDISSAASAPLETESMLEVVHSVDVCGVQSTTPPELKFTTPVSAARRIVLKNLVPVRRTNVPRSLTATAVNAPRQGRAGSTACGAAVATISMLIANVLPNRASKRPRSPSKVTVCLGAALKACSSWPLENDRVSETPKISASPGR